MDIVLASNNKHKVAELQYFMDEMCRENGMGNIKIRTLSDIGFTDEIIEDGKTFEDNALIKASAIAKKGYISVADDSGLMVDALLGEPGVYSARYAGEPCDDRKNNEKLLLNLIDVPEEKRTASFVSVIAGVFPDGRKIVARGECPGKILFSYRGNGGFISAYAFPLRAVRKNVCGNELRREKRHKPQSKGDEAFLRKIHGRN